MRETVSAVGGSFVVGDERRSARARGAMLKGVVPGRNSRLPDRPLQLFAFGARLQNPESKKNRGASLAVTALQTQKHWLRITQGPKRVVGELLTLGAKALFHPLLSIALARLGAALTTLE